MRENSMYGWCERQAQVFKSKCWKQIYQEIPKDVILMHLLLYYSDYCAFLADISLETWDASHPLHGE